MKRASGWERGNRTHFGEIVENYDRIRPEYPDQLFRDIFDYAGRTGTALEIGAGTGKATTPFLRAGYDVTAVEISANMADFLHDKFGNCNQFKVITEPFEEAALDENRYDLIYAASAFHWVDAKIGCPKVLRLLKSGGAFALFRYNNVPADGEALYEEIQAAYQAHFPGWQRWMKKSREDFWKPAEIYRGFRFEDMKAYGFGDIATKLYDKECPIHVF